jgi:TolB-like protein/DNA-binding winged helix-turn-helix (wHTH) protein
MAVIRFQEFELDTISCELRERGVLANLQPQPARVLALLASHPGKLIVREEIRKGIWGEDTFVDFDQGLNYCIRQIRTALRDDSERPIFVETLPRRGYRFIATVATVGAEPAPAQEASSHPSSIPGPVSEHHRNRSFYWVIGACASMALLASALVAWHIRQSSLSHATDTPPIESIAVLPLVNLSNDPEQQFFADGMTDELITNLAQISSLRVISHTSAAAYLGTHKTAAQIGRELGVEALVEGSVVRSGDKVRITAQLIHAASDRHLWAHTYDREMRDVLTVQGEVAREIAESISLRLTPQEQAQLSRSRPVNPEVALLYFKGSYFLSRFDAARAKKIFTEAIHLDPDSAECWAGLADALHTMGVSGEYEAFPQARDAANKALEIDGSQAQALMVLGAVSFLYDWNTPASEAFFRRSIAARPSYAMAHALFADILAHDGRSDEAIQQIKLASASDPVSVSTNSLAWHVYFCARQYDVALRIILGTVEVDPTFGPAHGRLVISWEQKGDYQKAIAASLRGHLIAGETPEKADREAAMFRTALDSSGPRGYWQHKLEIMLRGRAPDERYGFSQIARCYMHLGKREEALKALEKGYQVRDPYLIFWLPVFEEFDPLRSDPRFQGVLQGLHSGSR